MVLGLKSRHKKGAPITFEYVVHVKEIKPWPPSEALKSVQTVLLQWENGDQNSGSFLSVAGDSNIVFNESFVLPLTLKRDKKTKDKFKKNYLEFSLLEPHKDKAKGSLIGTVSVNLADYGVTKDTKNVDAPINLKKRSNNISHSALTISLEPVEREGSNSSYIDNDDNESEFAFITDDDASSHSSRMAGSFDTATTSPSRNDFKFSERSMTVVKRSSMSPLITSSPSSISFRDTNAKSSNIVASFSQEGSENSKNRYGNSNQPYVGEVSKRQVPTRSDALKPNRKALPAFPPASSNKARLKHMQSVLNGSVNGNGSLADIYIGGKPVDLDIPNGSKKKGGNENKEQKIEVSEDKNEWKAIIKILEEELKEVAAIEVGLYSVVAEHASSGNKVHAPARRISRFYTNACRSGSKAKRASTARAAVSGLVLVSKACGNDVPRLSFWLSNSIMLRAIVSQTAAELPNSNLENRNSKPVDESDDMEDVLTFIKALEKVESWFFSRIVESLWWQTFTPHMQYNASKNISSNTGLAAKKAGGKRNTFGYHEQGTLSMELWKEAFRDACEKLCPIRAVGHECGCLSVLVKLVMKQLVNRLDVAMFNAILRESAEEMPTDPVSDPITDPKVLPIPAGKSSFGAGAHLKNAISNWSRWLSDLFGLEDDSFESNDFYGDGKRPTIPFKAFRLLHALSDLMMLPFGMLADVSTRKEVCPTFGPEIIKRVLNFVLDEFSPNPIPRKIIDDLDSEESSDSMKDSFATFPCTAGPTKYSPPPTALLAKEKSEAKCFTAADYRH